MSVADDHDDLNHRCGKFNVGDKGQRYEVRYKDPDGAEHVFGWTDDANGGLLVQSIRLNPSMAYPRVVDRRRPDLDDTTKLDADVVRDLEKEK